MKANAVAPIIISLLLTGVFGCAVHSSQMPEQTIMPQSYVQAEHETPASPALDRWWERFNDQRLNDLINEALAKNLDIAQAFARLSQAQASFRAVQGAARPFVNLEGQAKASRQLSSFGDDTGTSTSLSAAAGYELDLWRKLASRNEAAWQESQAAAEDLKTLTLTLTAQLADLYYLGVEQRAQLKLIDELIKSYRETTERIERRYQEGLATAQDLYQARQNLATTKARRPVYTATIETTNHAISVLLGRFPEKEISGSLATIPVPPPFEAGLPGQLLLRRPDIKAAHMRLQAKDERIAAAIADRLPSVNLLAAIGFSETEVPVSLSGIFWNIMASAVQPVIDGGRRKAEVDKSEAAFDESFYRYQQLVLQSVQEVEDALARIKAHTERLHSLEKEALTASAANERLATEQYFQGLHDYLPVLIAQRFHVETVSQTLAAQRQVVSDYISLMRALGGDWMDEQYRHQETHVMKDKEHEFQN